MTKSFDELASCVMLAKVRARASRRSKELLAELLLSEIRKLSGKSHAELARQLGIKQPSLSKIENQDDMQISTLKKIIEAIGGQICITARFDHGDRRLKQFGAASKSKKVSRALRLVG